MVWRARRTNGKTDLVLLMPEAPLPTPLDLPQMVARKFGPEIAEKLAQLLARNQGPEHIDQVAAAILECDAAGDLLECARRG